MTIQDYIRDSGLKKTFIARTLGMKESTFAHKINGRRKWKVDEIKGLSKIIGVPVEELVESAVEENK